MTGKSKMIWTALEAEKHIVSRHNHWSTRLREWFLLSLQLDIEVPTFEIVVHGYKWAGRYNSKTKKCLYALPYCMAARDEFDQTVAHEVSHHFAKASAPWSKWHGDHFKFVLGVVCGMRPDTYHTYDVKFVKKIALMLQLKDLMK